MRATFQQGVNLAYWLYRAHPGLFNILKNQVAQNSGSTRLGRLGDNGDISFDTGDTPTFVVGADTTPDLSVVPAGSFPSISPDLSAMPDPALQTIGVDAATADISVPIDTGAAATAGAPAQATPASSSAGGIGSALASVGSFLASATGLTALTNLGTAYYKSNTPQAQTIATQAARVAAGTNPAAITYRYNTAGQLVPVLAQNGINTPLTPSTLSSLLPSSLSTYAIPIAIGIGVLVLALSSKRG